jgi:SOS-response transcriptional repressor LexA
MIVVADNTPNEKLIEIKKALNLSERKMAELLGVKQTTLHNWIYPPFTTVPQDVLHRARSLPKEVGSPLALAMQPQARMPMIGVVAASSPADWTDPMASEDWYDAPVEMGEMQGRFAARIDGDSMFDLLWPGDVAVFQKDPSLRIGMVVLFRTFDNLITVKQLHHDGKDFILKPLNPSYEECRAAGSVVGYLVGIIREIGTKKMTVYDRHGIRP